MISKGRTIVEVLPDPLLAPFMGHYAQKNVQKGLRKRKDDYTDENDWKMRSNLDTEADSFSFWDGIMSTYQFASDEEAIDHHHERAKRKIGK